jgi:hypothetical protein
MNNCLHMIKRMQDQTHASCRSLSNSEGKTTAACQKLQALRSSGQGRKMPQKEAVWIQHRRLRGFGVCDEPANHGIKMC